MTKKITLSIAMAIALMICLAELAGAGSIGITLDGDTLSGQIDCNAAVTVYPDYYSGPCWILYPDDWYIADIHSHWEFFYATPNQLWPDSMGIVIDTMIRFDSMMVADTTWEQYRLVGLTKKEAELWRRIKNDLHILDDMIDWWIREEAPDTLRWDGTRVTPHRVAP